ncbi:translation initiation factor IF-3 [Candidatus Poribacteria bacterium]|nr:translation initiation factor IF-3 [Candidatus Poribacteria bacterium]
MEVDPIKPEARTNEEIRVREVLLIDQNGVQVGVVPIEQALSAARQAQLDLVEVAPMAKPPVCRIYDFKRVLYEQKRRQKAGRKKARTADLKECKMRVTIDPHDRTTKLRRVREFLEEGDKVKFTFQYRGREITKPQLGETLIKAVLEEIQDIAEADHVPTRQEKVMHMIVSRRKDWKPPKGSRAALEAEAEALAEAEAEAESQTVPANDQGE